MTKYPIKHTMEFERKTECNSECGMRMKYPISCGQHNCEHLKVSVTFDLVKDCPVCSGLGYSQPPHSQECLHCYDNGLPAGKVHRYWTPEEAAEHIKKETGIDWEPTAVWMIHHDDPPFLRTYKRAKDILTIKSRYTGILLVADFGQPAPPADYRP